MSNKPITKGLYYYNFGLFNTEGKEMSSKRCYSELQRILKTHGIVDSETGRIAISLEESDDSNAVTLEVLQNEENFLFARMGRIKDNSHILWRYYRELKSAAVATEAEAHQKGLEIFTYVYIDFETMIITQVTEQSAPKPDKLKALFTKYGDYNPYCHRISNADIVQSILQAESVKFVDLALTIPDAAMLRAFNLSQEQIEVLEELKTLNCEVVLKSKGTSLVSGNKNVRKFMGNIFNGLSEKGIDNLKIGYKPKDKSKPVEKNLKNPYFKDFIEIEKKAFYDPELMIEEYFNKMLKEYEDSKEDLLLNFK